MITNNNKVLLATLFISLSAHAGALYFLRPTSTRYSLINPGEIQINVVAITSKVTDKKKSVDNGYFIKNIKPVSSPVNHALKKARKVSNSDARLESRNENRVGENNSTNRVANTLTVQLRGKIKTALQKHLIYPQIARRRGWQGTVTIQVTIRGNGDLRQVKLGKSSGYTLLDDSAITALRKVGRLDELKPLLQGRTIPIELPIKYLLKKRDYGAPSV